MRDRRARLARVLVVEDNRVNRLLLCRSVELLGHRVEAVENGRLALAALRAVGAQAELPFDLILLDQSVGLVLQPRGKKRRHGAAFPARRVQPRGG